MSIIITSGNLMKIGLFPLFSFNAAQHIIPWWDYWQGDKISHITPGYWQGSGNFIRDNVHPSFHDISQCFFKVHQNHLECWLTMHIMGPPQTYWISEDGIHKSIGKASHPCDFNAHLSLITTGIRNGILCTSSPCIRYIWGGKARDMKFKL